MMKPKRGFLVLILLLGVFLCGTLVVNAQEKDDEYEEFVLEDITVTAQKRYEDVQKVPIAMEVLLADDLKNLGKNDLDEILSYSGSTVLNKAADGLRISLRGISDDSAPFHNQSVSMPSVAVNMDGVYSNRKDMGSGLFDLERVEVLYGPQSTMYSSNSPGGIVNVITASPKLDKYEASALVELGNYSLRHYEGMFNAPLGDSFAVRAAFSLSERDGYLSNGGDNEDSKSARLRALYRPNDRFSFMITGELSDSKSQGFGGVDAFVDQDDLVDPWYTERTLGDPNDINNERIYARMDLDLGFALVSLTPSYATREGKQSRTMEMAFGPVVEIKTDKVEQSSREKSIELLFMSPEDFFFEWNIGLNYYDASDFQGSLTYDEMGAATGEFRNVWMNEEAKAIFANITYPVTDKFRATLGYRYSEDEINNINDETRGTPPIKAPTEYHHDYYDDPDYKFGLEYDLSENSMLWADYSTSYRVQGMGGGGPPGGQAEDRPPEKLKAYQLGYKSRWLDDRLQINPSAFFYDYENYAAGDMVIVWNGTDVNNPMSNETTTDPNASGWGDGEMYGVDLRTSVYITKNDTLDFSISYTKSEWTDLVFDYEYEWQVLGAVPIPEPPGGEPVDPTAPPPEATPIEIAPLEDANYNGKPMTSAPDYTLTANYMHNFHLPNGATIDTRIDVRYKTEYLLTWKDKDYPLNYQEDFFNVDLSATYSSPSNAWSLTAYVRNLDDYAEKRGYFGDPINETMVGTPRTYGMVVRYKY